MPGSNAWRGLLLLAVLGTGALFFLLRPGHRGTFPELDPTAAARIELARGRDQLVLNRRRDTGQWEIASAEDAPADARRVEELLLQLAGARPGATVAAPADEPLALRVSDADGRTLAEAQLWPGILRSLPDGPAQGSALPVPALAPEAWSTLQAPRLGPIRAIRRLGPEGPQSRDEAEDDALANALLSLPTEGWVPARQINWAGARYYQIETETGLVEAQIKDTPAGRFVRLTAETRPDIRLARAFAFRLPEPR